MSDVAMHPTVGEKADQVKLTVPLPGQIHGLMQNGITGKCALLHRQADPGQVLIDDPSPAQVEVSHLGVSHLASGQTHRQAGCLEGGGGIFLPQSLQVGFAGISNGISLLGGAYAEAVHDYYRYWPHLVRLIIQPNISNLPFSKPLFADEGDEDHSHLFLHGKAVFPGDQDQLL